jgi:hypothetical protein
MKDYEICVLVATLFVIAALIYVNDFLGKKNQRSGDALDKLEAGMAESQNPLLSDAWDEIPKKRF